MLDITPEAKAVNVLNQLGEALESNDIDTAVDQFGDTCFWRDLVSFTWNIKTLESKDQIRDMLNAQLASVKPSNWEIDSSEGVTEDDGVITAWFKFETAVSRGYGLMRLVDDKIWTLLTTMVELKGFEEPKGFGRPLGAKHGQGKHRTTWK
mgnify:FL=1